MKVILVSRFPRDTGTPRGGIESVTVVLARALHRIPGVEVGVLTVESDRCRDETSEQDGITVHRLGQSGWPQLLDVHVGPSRRKILSKLEELQPDIVHWHETWGLRGAPTPLPQVFTIHGFDSENVVAEDAKWKQARSRLWKLAEARGFRGHDDVISITPYVRNRIASLTSARIHEIDNPLDERFFNLARHEANPPRVLCVGWISARKNTLGSVRAFGRVLRNGGRGKLVIAGAAADPAYHRAVQQEVVASALESHVEFLGHVNHEAMAEELGRASVFLLPSLQENAPMAITEAMAARVPVIASNRCGMPYMVEDGVSGYLVDPLDEEDIASRLAALLGNRELRARMGARGRMIAESRFHPAGVAARTVEVYRGILDRSLVSCP